MDEKEARATVEKYAHFDTVASDIRLMTREDRITVAYREAKAYLAALDGPEVNALVDVLKAVQRNRDFIVHCQDTLQRAVSEALGPFKKEEKAR